MIKYRIFFGLICLGLGLFFLFCDSFVPLLIIIVFLSLTVLSVIVTAINSRFISVEACASHPLITKGEEFDAQFGIKITNSFFLPISAVLFCVQFHDMQESGGIRRKLSTTICAKETRTIYTMVSTSHCACIGCRVSDMYICDAFGLTRWKIKKGTFTSHMIIMPVMAQTPVLKSSPSINTDDSDRYTDWKKGDDPSQVFEVREYADGDDIRKIHWGLSSKYSKLMVKEFSLPISDSCVIVIETGIKNDIPENRKTVSDKLMSVFMKLSDELINSEQMFSVYWYSNIGDKIVCFDIAIHDDVFPAVEGFLSMKFSDEIGETLMHTTPVLDGNEKLIYYIFSSSSCNKEMINSMSEKYITIDVDGISS